MLPVLCEDRFKIIDYVTHFSNRLVQITYDLEGLLRDNGFGPIVKHTSKQYRIHLETTLILLRVSFQTLKIETEVI